MPTSCLLRLGKPRFCIIAKFLNRLPIYPRMAVFGLKSVDETFCNAKNYIHCLLLR